MPANTPESPQGSQLAYKLNSDGISLLEQALLEQGSLQQKLYSRAKENFNEVLDISKDLENLLWQAYALNNLGLVYFLRATVQREEGQRKELQTAEEFYKQAQETIERLIISVGPSEEIASAIEVIKANKRYIDNIDNFDALVSLLESFTLNAVSGGSTGGTLP